MSCIEATAKVYVILDHPPYSLGQLKCIYLIRSLYYNCKERRFFCIVLLLTDEDQNIIVANPDQSVP